MRSPMRFPPRSNCLANSILRTALSPSMRCTVKKTFEVAAQAHAQAIIQLKDNQPSLMQNAETACNCQHPTSSDTSITKARNGGRPGPLTYSARPAQLPTPNGGI